MPDPDVVPPAPQLPPDRALRSWGRRGLRKEEGRRDQEGGGGGGEQVGTWVVSGTVDSVRGLLWTSALPSTSQGRPLHYCSDGLRGPQENCRSPSLGRAAAGRVSGTPAEF